MKNNRFIIWIGIFIVSFLFAQNSLAQTEPPDTIFMLGGRKIYCKIIGVNSAKVTYKEVGKSKIEYVERKQVQKIVYKSGQKEVFNKPLVMDVEEGDYRTVILTENPADVEGLVKKGEIMAESNSNSGSKKSALRNAEIRLQKQASNLGAQIVLITKKEPIGGYGEIPSYRLEGVAYGFPAY